MSSGAKLNLVRVLPRVSSLEHDSPWSAELARHDEIVLASPDGEPAAMFGDYSEDDLDYAYDYSSGASGYSLRGSRMTLTLPIDFISGALARKLERWKRERAAVWLCPGFGQNTVFAWRAADIAGTAFLNGPTATDLTGQHNLTAVTSQYTRIWHHETRTFLPKTTTNRTQIISTPYGAGMVSTVGSLNRMVPTYPKSATLSSAPAASGWTTGGVHAADITAAFVPTGFGLPDCPASLRVSVAGRITSDRYLAVSDQFAVGATNFAGHTFVNGLAIGVTVWLKGRFTDGAALVMSSVYGTLSASHSLAGVRLDGWTPISLSFMPTELATGTLYLAIGLSSSDSNICQFEIGPTMVSQNAGWSTTPVSAFWSPITTGGSVPLNTSLTTALDLRLPGQGTIICSYFAPSDYAASWRAASATHILCGNAEVSVKVIRASSGAEQVIITSGTGITEYTAAAGAIIQPGMANTVAFTWNSDGVKLYVNGVLVMTDLDAPPLLSGNSSTWRIATCVAQYPIYPLAVLTCRIDEGAMTASEIADEHVMLTDPGANHLAVAVRGRQFRVVEVPMMVRGAYGGAQVFGPLVLEQCDYQHHFADPWNKEASVG